MSTPKLSLEREIKRERESEGKQRVGSFVVSEMEWKEEKKNNEREGEANGMYSTHTGRLRVGQYTERVDRKGKKL